MDQTGCPVGLFTDRFFPGHDNPATAALCLYPVAAWTTVGSVLAAIRLVCALLTMHVWRIKRASSRKVTGRAQTGMKHNDSVLVWLPVQPLASLGLALTLALYVILTSANVASASNGATTFLIALFMLFGTVSHFFFARKLLRLGKALFQSHQLNAAGDLVARVSKSDSVLKVLYSISVGCGLAMSALALALLAVPEAVGVFQAVFAVIGVYSLVQPLMIAWQLRRIVRAMDATHHATMDIRLQSAPHQDAKMQRTKRKILSQQIGVLLVGGVASLLNFLIASRVIPSAWFVVGTPHFAYEVAFEVFSLWNLHGKTLAKTSSDAASPSHSNKRAELTSGQTGASFTTKEKTENILAPQSSFFSSVG
jgi:hypothetical protein